MITIPLFEACVAIGGRPNKYISPVDYLNDVTQNSKEVVKGTLFVALRGNRVDGHDFIREAQNSGAIAAVVEYEVKDLDINIPQLIVPSTVEALGNLARIWRGRLKIPLVAVTGSVGKTSTKELIAHTLECKYKTHKSRKNFNNQLGVPIELLKLQKEHQCSVVELAMRGLNQINYLSKIARPTISAITNIGMSHMEMLGTRENIAKAKAEIYEGMDSEAVIILNKDDQFFDFIKELANCRVVSFGENKDADVRISDIQLNQAGNPTFRLNGVPITMVNCLGKHHAYNAAIAYTVGMELGVKQEDIANRISTSYTPEGRGVASTAKIGAILLDSTYNAAPDSIKAALYTLSEMRQRGKRTVAVIGEMLELGTHSEEAHRHIGRLMAKLGAVEALVTVGEYAKFIGEEAKINNWEHFENSILASKHLLNAIGRNDIVLLQGSQAVSLEIVVRTLENGKLDV
ncbi:MAG: UDP-N-acetylmuramoyl-tripeptide--D-alanyl-D-alanine ligase [Bacteroidia bacterium]